MPLAEPCTVTDTGAEALQVLEMCMVRMQSIHCGVQSAEGEIGCDAQWGHFHELSEKASQQLKDSLLAELH